LAEKYEVIVTPYAMQKVRAHMRFLANVSVPAAQRTQQALFKAVESLADNPLSYPRYESPVETDAELRKRFCKPRYLLIYEVIGKRVHVIDVHDCRQAEDKNLV